MKNLKTKVLSNVQRHDKKKNDYKKRYNKPKIIEQKTEINMNQFVYIPKHIVTNKPHLNKSSLAIYIVLCLQADFKDNKWFQISQANIAKLTGLSIPTVKKAIQIILTENYHFLCNEEKYPLLICKKTTNEKRHFYLYKVNFVRPELTKDMKGQYFSFFKCIVDNGTWANLKPRAKILYLVLRREAKFDFEFYNELEYDGEIEYSEYFLYSNAYLHRKWDVCTSSLVELCKIGNIEYSDIKVITTQLEKYKLIERFKNYIMVYLKTKKRIKFKNVS